MYCNGIGDNVNNMVLHLHDLLFNRYFVEFVMAQKSLKSFSINSILSNNDQNQDEDEKSFTEEGDTCGSDCESDLDVTGNDTPPLDCSQKSKETNKECENGKFFVDY